MDPELLGRAGTVGRALQQEQQLLEDAQTTLLEKLEGTDKTHPIISPLTLSTLPPID